MQELLMACPACDSRISSRIEGGESNEEKGSLNSSTHRIGYWCGSIYTSNGRLIRACETARYPNAFQQWRCYIAEVLLGWALVIYPSGSIEQAELAAILLPFMKRRLTQLTAIAGIPPSLRRK